MQSGALNTPWLHTPIQRRKSVYFKFGRAALGYSKFKENLSSSLLTYLKLTTNIDDCNNFFSIDGRKESACMAYTKISDFIQTFRQNLAFPSIPCRTNTALRVRTCNMRWCLSIVTW